MAELDVQFHDGRFEIISQGFYCDIHDMENVLLTELAVSLYQRNVLSFGKARELARMSKWDFHDELGKRQIARHYDQDAFEEDLRYGNA